MFEDYEILYPKMFEKMKHVDRQTIIKEYKNWKTKEEGIKGVRLNFSRNQFQKMRENFYGLPSLPINVIPVLRMETKISFWDRMLIWRMREAKRLSEIYQKVENELQISAEALVNMPIKTGIKDETIELGWNNHRKVFVLDRKTLVESVINFRNVIVSNHPEVKKEPKAFSDPSSKLVLCRKSWRDVCVRYILQRVEADLYEVYYEGDEEFGVDHS